MKVVNQTQYDTQYLRRLFATCEKHVFALYLQRDDPKQRHITVKSCRVASVGGYAWYNSYSIVMKLPPPTSIHLGRIHTKNKVFARRVAQVYLHEIGHNLNIPHSRMKASEKIDVSWWPDEQIPLKQVIKKPKPNIIELRAAKAQKKLDEWQHKLKRAKTGVRKYQVKVRYYEKKMAANK